MIAWRGVVVQVVLILSMLAITLVALFKGVGDGILHLLVGALCTAFGSVVAKARTDAGGSDGGSFTMRPPSMAPEKRSDPPLARRTAEAAILAVLVLASLLLVGGLR